MANGNLRVVLLGSFLGLICAGLGCGGDNAAGVADYLGTWTYTQQQATETCPGQSPISIDLGTTKDLREGVKSDLVDVSTICNYRFDIKDKIASIQSGQSCSFNDGTGGTAVETPSSWTFTLTSATTAAEKFTAVDTLSNSTACSFDGIATLERLTKN